MRRLMVVVPMPFGSSIDCQFDNVERVEAVARRVA